MSGRAGAAATVHEVAVAGLLHDIGKLLQRAHAGQELPRAVRDRAPDVLPRRQGRYSHGHALWSDLFFDLCGGGMPDPLPWPSALDRARVRDLAVRHHAPPREDRAAPHLRLCDLVTRADRLAAGRESKARDAAAEDDVAPDRRRAHLGTPLAAIVTALSLGGRKPEGLWHRVAVAAPEAILPERRPDGRAMEAGCRQVWQAFRDGWSDLCTCAGTDAAAFEEGLLSLSERTFWAVPSSTADEPDVSLHDHSRTVAAFAAALLRHHEAAGDLDDTAALRDGAAPRFRFVVGDLSGLQTTLFRLRAEAVPGLVKLLRGRSLRFQLLAEAAARRALAAFGMPMSAALQVAGGRFLLLVPALADAQKRLDALRDEADNWIAEQYLGDLTLGLALSDPFAPWDLMPRPDETAPDAALARARAVRDGLAVAVETAKLRQLEGPAARAVLRLEHPAGDCPACGIRPAQGAATAPLPCAACAAEIEAGRRLPRARAVVFGAAGQEADRLFGVDVLLPLGQGPAGGGPARGWRWLRPGAGDAGGAGPAALRAGPPWVARFAAGDRARYAALAARAGLALPEDQEIAEGEIKTFHALALDALEDEGRRGRPLLALLKGDVDRLGQIFAFGLGERWSVARTAQLSRLIDAYFALRLPHLLETAAPDSYTIYAGGDDFALILPWRQGFAFARRLARDFRAFAGGNPDLTLSLGIALFDVRTPVATAAREAEHRLEAAKADGRDRVSAIEPRTMTWEAFDDALAAAERFDAWLQDGTLGSVTLHRLLGLDDARQRIAAGRGRSADFGWTGRLGYTLARLKPVRGDGRMPPEVAETVRALFGLGPDWRPDRPPAPGLRLALTHALSRNR